MPNPLLRPDAGQTKIQKVQGACFDFHAPRCNVFFLALDARRPLIFHSASWPFLLTSITTTTKTMTSHPDTKIDCSKVYVKKSTFSNEETGDFDGAFAAVAIKEGEFPGPKCRKARRSTDEKCRLGRNSKFK